MKCSRLEGPSGLSGPRGGGPEGAGPGGGEKDHADLTIWPPADCVYQVTLPPLGTIIDMPALGSWRLARRPRPCTTLRWPATCIWFLGNLLARACPASVCRGANLAGARGRSRGGSCSRAGTRRHAASATGWHPWMGRCPVPRTCTNKPSALPSSRRRVHANDVQAYVSLAAKHAPPLRMAWVTVRIPLPNAPALPHTQALVHSSNIRFETVTGTPVAEQLGQLHQRLRQLARRAPSSCLPPRPFLLNHKG